MNKLSRNFLIISGFLAFWGFVTSHLMVFALSSDEKTFENLFITKINSVESYLLAIFFVLVAIYFKKHD